MKTPYLILTTIAFSVASLVGADHAPSPSLASFDSDVHSCRRTIREACAILQQLAPQQSDDPILRDKALAYILEAQTTWEALRGKYASTPPTEYEGDKAFSARLKDIANGLEDMRSALENGNPRRSMLACGFTCGLFVSMHEDNGLVYGLDRLYALRKTAKSMFAAIKNKGLDEAAIQLPLLQQQRNLLFEAPLPYNTGDTRNELYVQGVLDVSRDIDVLSMAILKHDLPAAREILSTLVPSINKPYGIAL